MSVYQVLIHGDQFYTLFQVDNENRAKSLVNYFNQDLDDETPYDFDSASFYTLRFHTQWVMMIQNDSSIYQQIKSNFIQKYMDTWDCSLEESQDIWELQIGLDDYEPRDLGIQIYLHGLNELNGEGTEILLQETDFAVGLLEEVQAVG